MIIIEIYKDIKSDLRRNLIEVLPLLDTENSTNSYGLFLSDLEKKLSNKTLLNILEKYNKYLSRFNNFQDLTEISYILSEMYCDFMNLYVFLKNIIYKEEIKISNSGDFYFLSKKYLKDLKIIEKFYCNIAKDLSMLYVLTQYFYTCFLP